MRRDRLAPGEATSQIYSAAELNTTQLKWDLAFLTREQFVMKYAMTLTEYSNLVQGQDG
jgi:hypothetical protein